jgi:hypothetical protein
MLPVRTPSHDGSEMNPQADARPIAESKTKTQMNGLIQSGTEFAIERKSATGAEARFPTSPQLVTTMATALKSCHLAINTIDAGEIDPCRTGSFLPRFQVVVPRTPPISIRFGRWRLRSALRCWRWQGPLENQVSRLPRIRPDLCWDRNSGAADCVLRSAQDAMSVIACG